MKKPFVLKAFSFVVCALLFSSTLIQAQEKPVASPADSVSGKVGNAMIEIKYGSPSVKGRKIWGGLEAYGKVWRAGANKATTFSTDKDIKVEGKSLPAGRYSFFAIPTEGNWTIIFNKTADQWGAYKYEESQDALRVTVSPKKASALKERLTYVINKKGVVLQWENIEVPISIK
ncbi:DUF2911 domain-containing protein [Arcticibacter eurypsychrophilus]|uniref:DUF2911 domain-containing protein n=1 Tax=Arcticibacter eurypsychrophilus TaxID=1434752 RepID=UPI00084D9FD1|nr:DUF2911 domain-containing protein [Arcticibacter eurypsychrophilus]